ncbi:hypothetical protein BJ508DRAFT_109621 [Ascobolus immersus RN42]|uniref:Uncharacterized protein n=1 Tax=Ascobolus immersus RN42 TaxID=1160509 RepID=A0A3N4I896_ASCIM|nr:hypothetical protein BJ508DRAFT_109621 [Ascobolus immersus RN42]
MHWFNHQRASSVTVSSDVSPFTRQSSKPWCVYCTFALITRYCNVSWVFESVCLVAFVCFWFCLKTCVGLDQGYCSNGNAVPSIFLGCMNLATTQPLDLLSSTTIHQPRLWIGD